MSAAHVLVTAKSAFTTISPDRTTVTSFDREGRLYSHFADGVTYRRTLGSDVEARWRDGARRRRRLTRDEALDLFAAAYQVAAGVYRDADATLKARLEHEILPWTPEALLGESERFAEVYKPVTILPPDQYLTIVLQATEGCTWNRCTFCNFYQDRPFRARSHEVFLRHIEAVQAFFGKGALMRKGVFLADGNALALSQNRLAPILEATRRAFPRQPIFSFIDVYTGERRSVESWKALHHLGLQRVYIGMETGDDALLHFLNKPGSREELVRFVHDLKEAGLHVSLILMVGIGGVEYREPHARASLETLARMPLGEGDLVYFSPFVEHPGSTYAALRAEQGLTPLSEAEVESELNALTTRVRAAGVKAARYDIREFLY